MIVSYRNPASLRQEFVTTPYTLPKVPSSSTIRERGRQYIGSCLQAVRVQKVSDVYILRRAGDRDALRSERQAGRLTGSGHEDAAVFERNLTEVPKGCEFRRSSSNPRIFAKGHSFIVWFLNGARAGVSSRGTSRTDRWFNLEVYLRGYNPVRFRKEERKVL